MTSQYVDFHENYFSDCKSIHPIIIDGSLKCKFVLKNGAESMEDFNSVSTSFTNIGNPKQKTFELSVGSGWRESVHVGKISLDSIDTTRYMEESTRFDSAKNIISLLNKIQRTLSASHPNETNDQPEPIASNEEQQRTGKKRKREYHEKIQRKKYHPLHLRIVDCIFNHLQNLNLSYEDSLLIMEKIFSKVFYDESESDESESNNIDGSLVGLFQEMERYGTINEIRKALSSHMVKSILNFKKLSFLNENQQVPIIEFGQRFNAQNTNKRRGKRLKKEIPSIPTKKGFIKETMMQMKESNLGVFHPNVPYSRMDERMKSVFNSRVLTSPYMGIEDFGKQMLAKTMLATGESIPDIWPRYDEMKRKNFNLIIRDEEVMAALKIDDETKGRLESKKLFLEKGTRASDKSREKMLISMWPDLKVEEQEKLSYLDLLDYNPPPKISKDEELIRNTIDPSNKKMKVKIKSVEGVDEDKITIFFERFTFKTVVKPNTGEDRERFDRVLVFTEYSSDEEIKGALNSAIHLSFQKIIEEIEIVNSAETEHDEDLDDDELDDFYYYNGRSSGYKEFSFVKNLVQKIIDEEAEKESSELAGIEVIVSESKDDQNDDVIPIKIKSDKMIPLAVLERMRSINIIVTVSE